MNKIINKRNITLVGMAVSILLVLMGILAMTGAFGGDAHYASGSSYLYDYGYATFGGDFYTYVSNNAAKAAYASEAAAANARELSELLKNVCGIALMGFGLFGLCHFGIQFCECPAPEKKEEVAAEVEAPAEEPEVQENT